MSNVKIKLFGLPEIHKDTTEIKFPFKKADALFYYLLIVKKTTRDHLVNMFWADSEDYIAKKNLRNAIYIIKKTLGLEIFLSPQRSMIELNTSLDLTLDIDQFNMTNEGQTDAISGIFLEGLHIKNCENFDAWLLSQRQYYESIYIQKTMKKTIEFFENKNYAEVEKHCKRLIEIDPFDEEIYRMLMKSYYESGRYDKSIMIYEKLITLLDEELAIVPDPLTTELYDQITEKRSQVKKTIKKDSSRTLYGREAEIKVLKNNLKAYLNGRPYNHYLIQGEIGIGKTELLNELVMDLDDLSIVRVFCYQPIEGYNLRAWDDLIEKLGDLVENKQITIPEYVKLPIISTFPAFDKQGKNVAGVRGTDEQIFKKRTVENAIYELIKIVTLNVKLLLIFEDIQWLDNPSLLMLKRLINERTSESPIVYITCRNAHNNDIEKFISEFSSKEIIKKLYLDRFTKKETKEFMDMYLCHESLTEASYALAYKETEGNAFFIMELINSLKYHEKHNVLSTKVNDSMKNRLLNLSKESLHVIHIASIYLKRFSVEDIISISEKSEFEVLDLIEELENMYLIKEEVNESGEAVYKFTHSKIKEYIYNNLSLSKRKILHTRIAKKGEMKLGANTDRSIYSKLVYHYTKANNKQKALEYRIKNLYEYLQSSHEVFPLIKEKDVFNRENIFLDQSKIEEEFLIIESLLDKLHDDYLDDHVIDLELKFKHMTGRHYINNGFYEKGLLIIHEVIELAEKNENNEYLIKAYLQKIFYAINTHKMTVMYANINLALKIAHKVNMKYEIGILLRLKGLYYVLESNFTKGEKLLLTSIDIMEKFKAKDKYLLNVAAAYYYMGDSNRFKGDFSKSLMYYEMAIKICEDNDLLGRLTLFYTNAGHTAYNLGEYELSQRYFESAIKLYEQLDFPWRRSIAYGFLGLLKVKKGKYDSGLDMFLLADNYAAKMKNPYELAVISRIKAELENMLYEGNIFSKKLQQFIETGGSDYIEAGIDHLSNFQHCYEMRRLKELKLKRSEL